MRSAVVEGGTGEAQALGCKSCFCRRTLEFSEPSLAYVGTLHPPPEDGEGPRRGPATQLVLNSCFSYGCSYACHQVLGWKLATCGATRCAEPSGGCHRCWAKAWPGEDFRAQNITGFLLIPGWGSVGRRGWERAAFGTLKDYIDLGCVVVGLCPWIRGACLF